MNLDNLPPNLREQFAKMMEKGQEVVKNHPKPNIPQIDNARAPLVTSEDLKTENGFKSVSMMVKPTDSQASTIGESLIFVDFRSFYNYLNEHQEIYKNNVELESFVNFVSSLDKGCGCTRGALTEKAKAIYALLLPKLQVETPIVFEQIKNISNSAKIVFKDGATVLLEV